MLWILGLVLLVASSAYALYRRLAIKRIPGIPHLESTEWLFGDLRPMLKYYKRTKRFHPYYAELSFYQFNFVAWEPTLVVCDPFLIEDIMKKDPLFRRSDSFVNVFIPIIPDATWRMLGEPTARPVEEGCFEIMPDISLLASDIISKVAFGKGYHQLESTIAVVKSKGKSGVNEFPIERSQLGWASSLYVNSLPIESNFPRFSYFLKRLPFTSFSKAERLIHKVLNQAIIEGRQTIRSVASSVASERNQGCLLDMVLAKEYEFEQEQGKKAMMTVEEIRDEMATLLFAGDESVSSSIGWAIRFLTQNPHIQRKLHKDIKDALPELEEREAQYEDINSGKAPYLDAIVQEVLRVAKTTMTTARTNSEETVIYGQVVPKNTEILLMLGMAGEATKSNTLIDLDTLTDTEVDDEEKSSTSKKNSRFRWSDDGNLASFVPERWIDSNGKFDPNAGPSMPFGAGPRACFGQKLAVLELKMFILMLSHRYFLDSLPDSLSDPQDLMWKEAVLRRPLEIWIRPRLWSEVDI
ncbi:Cytochrome P450 CYP4/CYP19/CYP26 subfamilies [Phaffia rhodozyma]|uniref:Cytochrome P450 CYP4/CYP19/CYP26 subfamilies n=1 Tax=Phaffia rhodozyma TaxID=264483 RepID=A0A0F7SS21_PHARH|nr:Cytochrome P450 CYP4/CYP19/CYP26 subfamilies [Phaffia rhodozyma]